METIIEALRVLYHDTDNNRKKLANKWLEEWRESYEAWGASDALLHEEAVPEETKLFCAQTIKIKILQDLNELKEEDRLNLRNSLILLLKKSAIERPPIFMQLSLALSYFVVQTPSSEWFPEKSGIEWIFKKFEYESNDLELHCLLKLLSVLVLEEVVNDSFIFHTVTEFKNNLKIYFPQCMQLLIKTLHNPEMHLQILETAVSWLKIMKHENISAVLIQIEGIIDLALKGIREYQNFKNSSNFIIEVLWITCFVEKFDNELIFVVNKVVKEIFKLFPKFKEAESLFCKNADKLVELNNEDYDIFYNMALLFCQFGEAYIGHIIKNNEESNEVLNIIICVFSFPDNTISSLAYDFLEKFYLMIIKTSFENIEISCDKDWFSSVYNKLIDVVIEKFTYSEELNSHEIWEGEDFNQRQTYIDILNDASNIIGSIPMLEILIGKINELSDDYNIGWQTRGALLFCINSIRVPISETNESLQNSLLKTVFNAYPYSNYNLIPLCQFIIEYNSWFQTCQNHFIIPFEKVIEVLIKAIEDDVARSYGVEGLLKICTNFGKMMKNYISLIMNVYESFINQTDIRGVGYHKENIHVKEHDILMITKVICITFNQALSYDERAAMFSKIINPLLPMYKSIEQNIEKKNYDSINLRLMLKRLSIVFKNLEQPEIISLFLDELWCLMETAIYFFNTNEETLESICTCIRHGIKASRKFCINLLSKLSIIVPKLFLMTKHSAFLYMASEFIKTFGSDESKSVILKNMIENLLPAAFQQVRCLKDLDSKPDLADDIFILATRLIQYFPRFLQDHINILEDMINTACTGILVQHKMASSTILSFISNLLSNKNFELSLMTHIHAIFSKHSSTITKLLLAGIIGALPYHQISDINDVISAFLKNIKVSYQNIKDILKTVPDISISAPEKKSFLNVLICYIDKKATKVDVENSIFHLADISRKSLKSQKYGLKVLLTPELYEYLF